MIAWVRYVSVVTIKILFLVGLATGGYFLLYS